MPRENIPQNLTPKQKKIRQTAQVAAAHGRTCPSKETLIATRNYTEVEVEIYQEAYRTSAGTQKEQALKKARRSGWGAANHKLPPAPEAELIARGYDDDQITAYREGYETTIFNQKKRALGKKEPSLAATPLQQFIDKNNDVSLTVREKNVSIDCVSDNQDLVNEPEEFSNDNGLFFSFNVAELASLAESNFLALFQEPEEKNNYENYSLF